MCRFDSKITSGRLHCHTGDPRLELAFEASRRICILRQGIVVADLPTDEAKRRGMAAVLEFLQNQPLGLQDSGSKEGG